MSYQFYPATVIKITDETPRVKRFFLKMPDDFKFEFKAGQFVMLNLPLEGKITNRSYSIASAPSNDNTFELCASLKEEGKATPWLWEHVKVGTTLECTGALGKFILPELINSDLCFIATGTGIAPLRSMIHDILLNQKPHKNIYLVFGNRWIADILFREEFEELARVHPEFKFIPVLSRETEEAWKGYRGYVHQVYQALFEDNQDVCFYLCGWSNMIREARELLKLKGYTKTQIKFELYD